MTNPYETPDSQLVDTSLNQEGYTKLKRFSTWGVLGLSIITLSTYTIYWLYSRTVALNKQPGVTPISGAFMSVATVLYVIPFLMIIPESIYPENSVILLASNMVSIASNIFFLVWVFKYKNRLNVVLRDRQVPIKYLGSIMTFIFTVLYLSYKTNEYVDALTAPDQDGQNLVFDAS